VFRHRPRLRRGPGGAGRETRRGSAANRRCLRFFFPCDCPPTSALTTTRTSIPAAMPNSVRCMRNSPRTGGDGWRPSTRCRSNQEESLCTSTCGFGRGMRRAKLLFFAGTPIRSAGASEARTGFVTFDRDRMLPRAGRRRLNLDVSRFSRFVSMASLRFVPCGCGGLCYGTLKRFAVASQATAFRFPPT